MAVSWEDSQPDTHSYILLLMPLFCHSLLYSKQCWLNTFNFESQELKYSSKNFLKGHWWDCLEYWFITGHTLRFSLAVWFELSLDFEGNWANFIFPNITALLSTVTLEPRERSHTPFPPWARVSSTLGKAKHVLSHSRVYSMGNHSGIAKEFCVRSVLSHSPNWQPSGSQSSGKLAAISMISGIEVFRDWPSAEAWMERIINAGYT